MHLSVLAFHSYIVLSLHYIWCRGRQCHIMTCTLRSHGARCLWTEDLACTAWYRTPAVMFVFPLWSKLSVDSLLVAIVIAQCGIAVPGRLDENPPPWSSRDELYLIGQYNGARPARPMSVVASYLARTRHSPHLTTTAQKCSSCSVALAGTADSTGSMVCISSKSQLRASVTPRSTTVPSFCRFEAGLRLLS